MMTIFTTRVELHDADWSDYERLHREMARHGFEQTIRADSGIVYELPPAEYNLEADITRKQAIDRAKASVGVIRKGGAILVTESVGRSWSGLSKV